MSELIRLTAYSDNPDFQEKLTLINALHPMTVAEWYRGTVNRRRQDGSSSPAPCTYKRVVFNDKARTIKMCRDIRIRPRYPHQVDIIIDCDGHRYPANEILSVEIEVLPYSWIDAPWQ